MKLHILSDLHVEFEPFYPPKTDADLVILAGDIHVGKKGINWAKASFPELPVLYVLGNHDYYGRAYPKHINDLKELAAGSNIHILETDRFIINNVVFLGCTLWTDFGLFDAPKIAGYHATQIMTDYRKIRVDPQYHKLRSVDTAVIHSKSLRWLQTEVENCQRNKEKIVIVTHHAPSGRSLPEFYRDNILSAAYASHLDDFVAASQAQLWIHGHIHTQQDYVLGNTRILCNPRGYPDEPNENFIPGFIVEL